MIQEQQIQVKPKPKRISTWSAYYDYPDRFKGSELHVNREQYSKIIRRLNDKIFEKILVPGYEYKALYNGRFQIIKRKQKGKNKALSFKLGKNVNYSNLHTDGYTCKLRWLPPKKSVWNFIPVRTKKRKNSRLHKDRLVMSEYIRKNGVNNYLEPNYKV